jgi:hypothetical protein
VKGRHRKDIAQNIILGAPLEEVFNGLIQIQNDIAEKDSKTSWYPDCSFEDHGLVILALAESLSPPPDYPTTVLPPPSRVSTLLRYL